MKSSTRAAIGIPLSIVGAVCFIGFMWIGVFKMVGWGYIAASVIFLFAVFGGGVLVSLPKWIGLLFTISGSVGAIFFGLLAWFGGWSMGILHDVVSFLILLIFGTLAGISSALLVNGLGSLFGCWLLPGFSKIDSNAAHHSLHEPDRQD